MIKILTRFNHIKKPCKLNSFAIISNFTSNSQNNKKSNRNYPYVFGGGSLKGPLIDNKKSLYFLKNHFQQNTLNGFKQAYKSILHSLAQKDMQSLEDCLSPQILQKLRFKDVQLLNPDAEIEIACGKGRLMCEARFLRKQNSSYFYLFDDKTVKIIKFFRSGFQLNNVLLDLFIPAQSNTSFMELLKNDIPVLFTFDVLFKSKMKLVEKNNTTRQQDKQEIHSIQFELQTKINIWNQLKGGFLNQAISVEPSIKGQKPLMEILGDNYEWKVGDIDKLLRGNFNLIN